MSKVTTRKKQTPKKANRKAPARKTPPTPATPQITTGNPQGPLTPWFQLYNFRKVSGDFYEVLREGIPIIDSAIRRLISLNGTIKVIGDNMALVKELEDFCLNVPVNDMQKGIHAFLENFSNETFEQGFSISEFIATRKRDDIERLQVADSKRITFRRTELGRAEPWYWSGIPQNSNYTMPADIIQEIISARYGQVVNYNGVEDVKLNMDNKLYFSINNENSDPYGVSIMRSLEFIAQILVTLENSMKSTAERFGDPSFHAHYKGKGSNEDIKTRRSNLQTDLNTVLTAKRNGKSGDLVTAGGPDSEVEVKIIGHEGQLFQYEIPLRHLLEQIVSKTNLPSWMLGIYWSTTERMATLEVESALADAKIRQFAMLPELIRLFSAFLRLRGRNWNTVTTSLDEPGDWGIIFQTPNLRDLVAQAQALFLTAEANQLSAAAGTTATGKNASESGKCTCGKEHHGSKEHEGSKETQRPKPWPELDKVETEYETTLKDKWTELADRILTIVGLNAKQSAEGIGHGVKGPEDLPDLGAFQFTTEQRAQVMKAYRDWLGEFDLSQADSPVLWVYGEAYSLGLIQAAKLIGKDRPILDIIKNKEVFDQICKNGFQLVKENATKTIADKIIPEMDAQMLAGTNPRLVADRLRKLFGDKNSDWERLARSEMSMAAEKAKLDEWAAWKVKKVDFVPAPDACPICVSLAGDYPIAKCPVPVEDTHPRCRCSTRPAASEAQGA
jgi:SPP1 gp7 family putative phage head morphogenesis protein